MYQGASRSLNCFSRTPNHPKREQYAGCQGKRAQRRRAAAIRILLIRRRMSESSLITSVRRWPCKNSPKTAPTYRSQRAKVGRLRLAWTRANLNRAQRYRVANRQSVQGTGVLQVPMGRALATRGRRPTVGFLVSGEMRKNSLIVRPEHEPRC